MKDLYTFDLTAESAIETYRIVSAAYRAFFSDLKLPILVAEASSGDMGGDHSHEYHLANSIGEDTVAVCRSCGYTANDEVAVSRASTGVDNPKDAVGFPPQSFRVWRGITKDRKTLVNAWYPHTKTMSDDHAINIHAIKSVVSELDASISDVLPAWNDALELGMQDELAEPQIVNVVDSRLASRFEELRGDLPVWPSSARFSHIKQSVILEMSTGEGLNLLRLTDGDGCPRCDQGFLQVHRALELGHTFYLGTRYSKPLDANVSLPQHPRSSVPLQMGCYGIGVSRIFGAVAEHKSDDKGLNWPRAIAPFEVIIIPTSGVTQQILDFYDKLANKNGSGNGFDVVLDDRKENFGWKMQDADTTGYPVTVVLGKVWREKGVCEVQCRNLSIKEQVASDNVSQFLRDLLAQL